MARLMRTRSGGPRPKLPLNTVAPSVTPTSPANGNTLTCNVGTWEAFPAPTFTYRWVRGANTTVGTNSPTYVSAGDVGQTLKCEVTATNWYGTSITATSNVTAAVV
jgi:hypothetical protein